MRFVIEGMGSVSDSATAPPRERTCQSCVGGTKVCLDRTKTPNPDALGMGQDHGTTRTRVPIVSTIELRDHQRQGAHDPPISRGGAPVPIESRTTARRSIVRPQDRLQEGNMVTAYIMIKADTGEADRLKNTIAGIDGVVNAHVVAGDVDFIAKVEVSSPADVKEIAATQIQEIEGVETTQTYIAMD